MNIIIYAGSLRPGGGLTVAKLVIEALAKNSDNDIAVYTGEDDSSVMLQSVINEYGNIKEVRFYPGVMPPLRYLLSKVYFLITSLWRKKSIVLSFNYYIPSLSPVIVYHISLLNFMLRDDDSWSDKLKKFDAKAACMLADKNIFESFYLYKTAKLFTNGRVRNKRVHYVAVDEQFSCVCTEDQLPLPQSFFDENNVIISVSSIQPHKDNETALRILKKLSEVEPLGRWQLLVVGGQSVEQWDYLRKKGETMSLTEQLRFMGPVNKRTLSCFLNKSVCLINTSKVESFCMVAIEAMAAGCPVVVTDQTSMPESVENAAVIVPAGDESAFVSSILEIKNNNKFMEKMVDRGLQHSSKYSVERFSEGLVDIVNEINAYAK